ncbi:MAG: alpha/beta fold hydrolase [Planctomycetota bacterium]|jgi:pimeloyl-ACP methyl ester carboxylesterase
MKWIASALLLLAATVAAGPIKQKEPGPKAKGKRYEWKASNGGLYLYYVPKNYDPEKGANLTFILHGSNGSRGWGFGNCPVGKTFRPDDIIVSPDGSQANGRGGYNRDPNGKELEYLHTLHTDLRKVFNIRQTFLYGHSQGSYFCHYYAAAHPDEVDGIVAMASGIWEHPNFGQAKHQAIVVMHGTYDPVVPYGFGVHAYRKCREVGYPKLHFRSLEAWNHWPTDYNSKVPHTAQQLAWCEGMTTKDMDRLKVSFEFLATVKAKERHDYAGVYSLAKHIANLEGAPDALKKRAERAMKTVDAGAKAHIAALKRIPDPVKFEKKPWVGHLPMFLRAYRGVPAREAFAKKWEPVVAQHGEAAVPHLRVFFRSQDPAEAFAGGVEAIKVGFLHYECIDPESFRNKLRQMRNNKQIKLGKDELKAYDALVSDFEKALKDAFRSFDGVNRKVGKL